MKRIEVDPADVRIVTGGAPPPATGAGAWLRRYRLRIAGALAIAEAVLWAFDVSKLLLLGVAVGAVAVHFLLAPRLGSYVVSQITWTIAFAQILVAVGMILLVVTTTLIAIVVFGVLVLLVVGGLAALLGDRR